MKAADLLDDLIIYTRNHLAFLNDLDKIQYEKLNERLSVDSWSVLECLQHLILYGDFYLPEIEARINRSNTKSKVDFKPDILGNYFAKSMFPKEKLNKMKTFNSMNPIGVALDKSVVTTLKFQLEKMLDLLATSKHVDLNKVKTSVSISPFIKLKLGDTLRIVIYHNERHIKQVKSILNKQVGLI